MSIENFSSNFSLISAMNSHKININAIQKIWQAVDFSKGGLKTKNLQAINGESIYEKSYNNIVRMAKGAGTSSQIASALGREFENFLANCLQISNFGGAAGEQVNALGDSLIAQLTGGISGKSALVSGAKPIRPDIMLMYNSEISGVGTGTPKITSNNINTPIELEEIFDISSEGINDSQLLQQLLNNQLSNAFGLSLKIWKNANSREFSSSMGLKNSLQNTFDSTYPHTWNSNYTSTYVIYQISRLLINIISPTNVMMVTGNGVTWMDDFLASHLFYMDVQMNSLAQSSKARAPGYEGHPQMLSEAIKIRNVTTSVNHVFYTTIGNRTTDKNIGNTSGRLVVRAKRAK